MSYETPAPGPAPLEPNTVYMMTESGEIEPIGVIESDGIQLPEEHQPVPPIPVSTIEPEWVQAPPPIPALSVIPAEPPKPRIRKFPKIGRRK